MIPGLAGGPPFPREAKKDSIVAVASVENPSVPMVVGVCEIDVSELQKVQGEKGRAVRGVHWEGDELWAWNTTDTSGGSAPERILGWEGLTLPRVQMDNAEDCGVMDDRQEDGGVALHKLKSADDGNPEEETAKRENREDTEQIEAHADENVELSTKGESNCR